MRTVIYARFSSTLQDEYLHELAGRAATRITALEAREAELVEGLRNMADVVAVWAMQPTAPTRQRDRWHQDQWDQLSQVCGEMLEATLAKHQEGEGK